MANTQQQPFPQINSPMVFTGTGIVQQTWYQFFVSLWNRTGGATGLQPGPSVPVTPSSSPFSYTAPSTGALWISPGTYAQVSYNRGGTTINYGSVTRGIFPMALGDTITVTYTTLTPTINFVPS